MYTFFSYCIVKINPFRNKTTGKYDYENFGRSLATVAMSIKLLSLILKADRCLLAGKFNHKGAALAIDRFGALDAGILFESLIRGPSPFYGKTIKLTSLQPSRAALVSEPPPSWEMDVPGTIQLLPNRFQDKVMLKPNIFYTPLKENFEGIDSFCFTGNEKSGYNLTVFQITLSGQHHVNKKGIEFVLTAMGNEAVSKLMNIHLVFVVPVGGTMFLTQTITSMMAQEDEQGGDKEIKGSEGEDNSIGGDVSLTAKKKRGRKRKETSQLPSVVDPAVMSKLLKEMIQCKYEHRIIWKDDADREF
jgi:hypothetical protein